MNTPKYRQQWILDELKKSPNVTHRELFGDFSVKFGKTERTFDKDWKCAVAMFKEYQNRINEQVERQTIAAEVEARKDAVLTKVEALAILSDIANENS